MARSVDCKSQSCRRTHRDRWSILGTGTGRRDRAVETTPHRNATSAIHCTAKGAPVTRLFQRKGLLVVDADLKGGNALSIPLGNDSFDARFDIRKDPQIEVFNLTEDHRSAISQRAARGPIRVRLEAGYQDGTSRIYEGDLRIVYHEHQGPDWVTRIESADGDQVVQKSRISRSWGAGTPVQTVIRDIAQALSIGEGNVKQSTAGAVLTGLGPTFPGGTAVCGSAARALTQICRSAGITWSINDGTLQMLADDKALDGTAVKVSPSTGLEGAAEFMPTKSGTRLRVRTRLIPGIWPGRKIQLADGSIWRCDKTHYHGETHGPAWGIVIEGRPV
jgi:hypothetical protein